MQGVLDIMSKQRLCVNKTDLFRGDFCLAHGVEFAVNAGEMVHLVGANGQGKTTLLMMIVGALPVLTGKVKKDDLLFIGHETGLHDALTAAQNLQFLASLMGAAPSQDALAKALAAVGLAGYEDTIAARLSAGQRRRVNLARLWLTAVEAVPLIVLDEPFTALDAAMVDKLTQRLQAFCAMGGAVLLTSHQAVVADKVVDLAQWAV